METDNFATVDYRVYSRALTAARISGAILLLISGAVFGMQCTSIPQYAEIFDNMVTGGKASMPKLTVLVLDHRLEIVGLGAVIGLSALAYILAVGRNVARVIAVSTIAVLLLLGAAFLIHLSMTQPLITIVTKFNG